MAEIREYLVQTQENGCICISEEVVASIAALAVREVEGVYGLSANATLDISNILGRKNLRNGIRVRIDENNELFLACNLVVKMGCAVMDVAQEVQKAIADAVISMAGVRPTRVDVNVCGVVAPRTAENGSSRT